MGDGPGWLSMCSYSLGAGRYGDRIPVETGFSAPLKIGPGTHPASYAMGTGSYPGVNWPGRDGDHLHPSSAEVNRRVELYFYPSGPSWFLLGWCLIVPLPLPYVVASRRHSEDLTLGITITYCLLSLGLVRLDCWKYRQNYVIGVRFFFKITVTSDEFWIMHLFITPPGVVFSTTTYCALGLRKRNYTRVTETNHGRVSNEMG